MAINNVMRACTIAVFCSILSSFTLQAADIHKTYSWLYDKKIYTIEHTYTQHTYDYYHKLRRTYTSFLTYLDESPYFPVVEQFADEFRQIAAENRFSDWQTVECVITFIQSLKYTTDGMYEYPKFPVETLVDKGGDCEDTAILLEAILQELGFDCVLVSPTKHMGVGIALQEKIAGAAFEFNNKDYYYVETTSSGWCIGDYPEHLSAAVNIYDPGQPDDARLLSADDYTFASYNRSYHTDMQAEEISTPANNEPAYEYTPNKNTIGTNTIEIDEMVIDGEKQTVVTQSGNSGRVIATEQ